MLGVDRTPVDHALVGFAEDGVERFLDVEVHEGVAEGETDRPFHALERVGAESRLFQKIRPKRHRLTQPLRVRIRLEDLHGKRDAENGLATEQILPHGFHDKVDHIILRVDLRLVDQEDAALLVEHEVVLEHDVVVEFDSLLVGVGVGVDRVGLFVVDLGQDAVAVLVEGDGGWGGGGGGVGLVEGLLTGLVVGWG